MPMDKPVTRRLFAIRKDLLHSDSLLAVPIFIVVGVFLVSLVISVWNNIMFQRDVREKACVHKARAIGSVLAKAAEGLMAGNELSSLRRVVVEAGVEHDLTSCRVLLPDGGVLADANPTNITTVALPSSWEGVAELGDETFTDNAATLTFPLQVPGRGNATLEVVAGLENQRAAGFAPPTAQMTIACLALATMLLVHRHARFRLKAISAIHEVLWAVRDGQPDVSTLELDPKLGQEAIAWNKLLDSKQSERVGSAIQRVREVVHDRSESDGVFFAAFDAFPYGLLLVDAEMQAQQANGAAGVLLRTERSQLLGAEVSCAITEEAVLAGIRRAVADPAATRAVVEVEQGGSIAAGVLRFTISPIRTDHSGLALVTIEDVTQQRVAEMAMNSFLAKAAHELRTPLTNIRLYVEDALERVEHDAVATSKCLNIINDESQRLDRTVSEILSVSEIEAGSFDVKRDDVHLDVMLEQVKADHEPQAKEKRITLEFDLPPKLPVAKADHNKIALVLHNLMGNALKYTLPDGHIVVSANAVGDRIIVTVTDTGLGIAAEEFERVFDKFYRSKNPATAGIKGSGLGLAIAREVARLHGGDITVESELGKGSTFTLTLPIGEETT